MKPRVYNGSFPGITHDDLQSMVESLPVFVRNVEIASDTTIHRGDLLCATNPRGEYHLANATDAAATNRWYGIAIDDYAADAEHYTTQIYISGVFHEEKINTASSDTAPISLFELELRRQMIYLRSLKDRFGHFDKTNY